MSTAKACVTQVKFDNEFAGISARRISRDRNCLNPWVATQKSVNTKASRSKSQHSSVLQSVKKIGRTWDGNEYGYGCVMGMQYNTTGAERRRMEGAHCWLIKASRSCAKCSDSRSAAEN
jgi:hypothetical protein